MKTPMGRLVACVFAISCISLATGCLAKANVRLEVELPSAPLSAGEPIIATFTIRNGGTQRISVMIPGVHDDWLSVSATRGAEHLAVPKLFGLEKQTGTGMVAKLEPNSTFVKTVVLSRYLPLLDAGTYTVTCKTTLLARKDEVSEQMNSVERTFELAVAITGPDLDKLQAQAEKLRQKAISEIGQSGETTIQTIFSLPDEVGTPFWQALVSDQKLEKHSNAARVVDELRARATPIAVALLYQIWRDKNPRGWRVLARQALYDLYSQGDAELSGAVKQLFIAREGKAPPVLAGAPYP